MTLSASAVAQGSVGSKISTSGFTFDVDEPEGLGGQNTAANPLELYLSALLSCQIATFRFWSEHLGIKVGEISAKADGDIDVKGFFGLDPNVPAGYKKIKVHVTVSGPETEARYKELQAAVDAHCPVFNTTVSATPIETTLTVAK